MKRTLMVDKSKVMKRAWELFKMAQKWVTPRSFSECLKQAWTQIKKSSVEFIGQVELFINGCKVIAMTATGYVEGNTFKAKETLKQYGLGWNAYEKVWEGTHSQLQDLCRAYA